MAKKPETSGQLQKLAENAGASLPPPGDERRDELKRRTDALAQQAQQLVDEAEVYGIDPTSLEVENEIASRFNELEVSDPLPGYRYRWVWTGMNSLMVKRALAERFPGAYKGWEIVTGEMPEAQEAKDGVTGARRVGDAILLRCTEEFYQAKQRHVERMNALHRTSVTATLRDMAAKYAGKGLQIHISDDDMESPVMKQVLKRMMAREIAGTKFVGMLKSGTVPGAEIK